VIPAFQESRRLPFFLRALCEAVTRSNLSCAVRVVDDGSSPEEGRALDTLVESLRSDHACLLPVHHLSHNQGKGAAIRAGWALGEPDRYQGFVDADGAISPDEIVRLASEALSSPEGGPSYFASRVRMLGRRIERNEFRHYSGRIFATLVGYWIDSGIYDSQCGFKLVEVSAWRAIAPDLQENGFVFDVELFSLLRQRGFTVVESPIDWTDQPGSKVRLFSEVWRMVLGLRRIRRRIRG
jgi:glycosyltransferase involved in cell wall biosynthesis